MWQDQNQNGQTDAGEFVSLSDLGIESIDLALNGDAFEAEGAIISNTTTATLENGDTLEAWDVGLRTIDDMPA